jgi:hypothetical protein
MNYAKFKRVGRDSSLQSAYATMTTRLHLRQTVSSQDQQQSSQDQQQSGQDQQRSGQDRQNNPLPATWATTGGGKSFFLDELGALRLEDLELCKDTEMKTILQNTVSLERGRKGERLYILELEVKCKICLIENMLQFLSLLMVGLHLQQKLMTISTTLGLVLQCVLCTGTKNYI